MKNEKEEPQIYDAVGHMMDEHPAWRIFEALILDAEQRIANAFDDRTKKFWELNRRDLERLFRRAEKQ